MESDMTTPIATTIVLELAGSNFEHDRVVIERIIDKFPPNTCAVFLIPQVNQIHLSYLDPGDVLVLCDSWKYALEDHDIDYHDVYLKDWPDEAPQTPEEHLEQTHQHVKDGLVSVAELYEWLCKMDIALTRAKTEGFPMHTTISELDLAAIEQLTDFLDTEVG
jgi:hypothetical protein